MGELLLKEIKNVENCLIKFAQPKSFHKKIITLQNNKQLPKENRVFSLSIFLDNNG